jgi:hypothetical protein
VLTSQLRHADDPESAAQLTGYATARWCIVPFAAIYVVPI